MISLKIYTGNIYKVLCFLEFYPFIFNSFRSEFCFCNPCLKSIYVETMRTMLTQSLAVLMPFNVQELNDEGGVYYGINQVSKNINIGNRKKLINGNGFVFGVPGSGKSFFCKAAMGQVFLSTDDEIIIIDPMNGATRWQLKRLSTYASRLYKNN